MNPELAAFLAAIQKRHFVGAGIGTAAGYVQTVLDAAKVGGFCAQFPTLKAADVAALVKSAADKFVYRCPIAEPLFAVTKAAGAGKIETFGTPIRKDAALSKSSVMDFENILTTNQQDRDGDILHPKGCKVDPSAPLLWQHIPTEPIGKLVQVVEQTDDFVKTHCAIADTPLGNLSAKLVEFGGLRISHGFKPLNWKAISEGGENGGMITGWEVIECEVMEISLVSVPANVGAVITAYQKNQKSFAAAGPMVEAWAKSLWSERPAQVVSGFGGTYKKAKVAPVVVNVNLGDTKAATKAEGDDPDDKKKPKKDDKPADDKPKDKPDDEGGKGGNMLSEIAERAEAMAADEKLSNEVRARCSVVAGILRDVGAGIASAMETISAAAEAQDIAKLIEAQQTLSTDCGKRLQRAAGELTALLDASSDLEEGAAGAVQEMAEAVGASLAGIVPAGAAEGEGDETGQWVQLEGDSEDKDEDEEEEKDDEDSEEEEGKEEDKDEDDDTEGDEDEEKDDDEEEEKDEDETDDESEKDDTDGSTDTGVVPDKDDDGDEEDEEEEKDDDTDDDEEKEDEDDEREDKEDDEDERDEKDEDEEEEEKPKGKGKPKATDLNTLARKLAADAMVGNPIDLNGHKALAAGVLAGGSIDPATLLMYRQECGEVLKKLTRPQKKAASK